MTSRRFFPGWTVVGASGAGIAFGSAVFISSSFALLAAAIGSQFGWSQTDLAKGASIVLLMQIVMYPACGWALDRWGSRKVGAISVALFGAALVALSQVGRSLPQFYLAFLLIGLLGTGTNVVSYARALTLWFDRKRGLALGLAAGCQAVGGFVMPIFMQKTIATQGWPTAVLILAAFELVVLLPIVALFVKDSPRPYGWLPDGGETEPSVLPEIAADPAPELSGIVRSDVFWKLAIGFAIMGLSFYAWITNVAFILTKTAAMSLAEVAVVQAVAGIAFLVGRIVFGWLLDKVHAPLVAIASVVLSALFYATWGGTSSHAMVFLGIILGGVSAGGEGDLLPYLAGRYFGKQAVSKVFGWFLCAYVLGAAIGPVAFAQASQYFGGPSIPLYTLAALQIIPIVLFLTLGAYREGRTPANASVGSTVKLA